MSWWPFGSTDELKRAEQEDAIAIQENRRIKILRQIDADLEDLKSKLENPQATKSAVSKIIADIQNLRAIPLPNVSQEVHNLHAKGELASLVPEFKSLEEAHRKSLMLLESLVRLVTASEHPLVGGGEYDTIREARRNVLRLIQDEVTFINHEQELTIVARAA